MYSRLKLLLPVLGIGLAGCAEPYDNASYYPGYGYGYGYPAYVSPYPDYYSPFYGGLVFGGFGRDHDRDFDRDRDHDFARHREGGEHHGVAAAHAGGGQVANAPAGGGHQGIVGRLAGQAQAQRPH